MCSSDTPLTASHCPAGLPWQKSAWAITITIWLRLGDHISGHICENKLCYQPRVPWPCQWPWQSWFQLPCLLWWWWCWYGWHPGNRDTKVQYTYCLNFKISTETIKYVCKCNIASVMCDGYHLGVPVPLPSWRKRWRQRRQKPLLSTSHCCQQELPAVTRRKLPRSLTESWWCLVLPGSSLAKGLFSNLKFSKSFTYNWDKFLLPIYVWLNNYFAATSLRCSSILLVNSTSISPWAYP